MSGTPVKKIIIKKNSLQRFILPNDSNASPFIFFNKNIIEDQDPNIIKNDSLNIPVLLTQQAVDQHNALLQNKVICLKNEQPSSMDVENTFEEAGTSSEATHPLKNAPKVVLSGQKFILIKNPQIQNTILIKQEEELKQDMETELVDSHTNEYAERPKTIQKSKVKQSGKFVHKNEVDAVSHTVRLTYKKLPNIVIEPEEIISNPHKVIKNSKSERTSRTELVEPSSKFKIIKLPKDESKMREASPTNDDTIFYADDPLLIKEVKPESEDVKKSATKRKTDFEELIYVESVNDFDDQFKDEGRNSETQLAEVTVECDPSSLQEESIESDTSNVPSKKGRGKREKGSYKYQCSHCEESFAKEKSYRLHITLHVKDALWEDKPNSCWECNQLFATPEAWNKHILTSVKHKAQIKDIVNGCRFCGKTFPSPEELETHKAEGHSRKKKAKERKWPMPCALCGEIQTNYVRYWAHTRRAHPGEKYPLRAAYDHVCGECGKEFRCLALLKQHENIHRGVRPYACAECGKGFFTPLSLQNHKTTHSKVRPFVCETCGAAFKFKHNVERHQLVHTGERPFVCGECGRGFTTLFWTQLHVRKVHYNEHIPYKPRVRKHRPRKQD